MCRSKYALSAAKPAAARRAPIRLAQVDVGLPMKPTGASTHSSCWCSEMPLQRRKLRDAIGVHGRRPRVKADANSAMSAMK